MTQYESTQEFETEFLEPQTDAYINRLDVENFKDWLDSKDLKPKTLKEYAYYFNHFNYPSINQETVNRFLTKDYKRNGVARAFMKIFIEYLLTHKQELGISGDKIVELHQIIFTRATGRVKVKLPDKVTEITEQDILRIWEEIKEPRNQLLLLLQYYGALRLNELMELKISRINFKSWDQDKNNFGELIVYGKGGKERIAIIPGWLMQELRDYINTEEYKKINLIGKIDPITKEDIEPTLFDICGRQWWNILRKASDKVLGYPIKDHLLRHLRATHLHRYGKMDLMLIKEYLGHTNISSTQIYINVSKEELKKGAMDAAIRIEKEDFERSNSK
jgi:integrase/recombinase XerD